MLSSNSKIITALSGGGFRAFMFHAGVFKYLAEQNLLSNIYNISTVSGGSLFIGLLLSISKGGWPDDKEYLTNVLPQMKILLLSQDLYYGLWERFIPHNWSHLFANPQKLANEISKKWNVTLDLNDLSSPSNPTLSINMTTADTGKRSRFKITSDNVDFGDFILGYEYDLNNIPLALAMATSAAVPLYAGGYDYTFKSEPIRGKSNDKWQRVPPGTRTITLYDGGLYDNLGLESIFDSGKQKLKKDFENSFLIVSDAGKPCDYTKYSTLGKIDKTKRIISILQEQNRSLRIRSLMTAFNDGKINGVLIPIIGMKNPQIFPERDRACLYPTDLKKVKEDDWNFLTDFGYKMAESQLSGIIE